MLNEGVLKGPKNLLTDNKNPLPVERIFALHLLPTKPEIHRPGTVLTNIESLDADKNLPIMAASDSINIEIQGHGGHAGMPHQTRDPVIAAANTISSLQ